MANAPVRNIDPMLKRELRDRLLSVRQTAHGLWLTWAHLMHGPLFALLRNQVARGNPHGLWLPEGLWRSVAGTPESLATTASGLRGIAAPEAGGRQPGSPNDIEQLGHPPAGRPCSGDGEVLATTTPNTEARGTVSVRPLFSIILPTFEPVAKELDLAVRSVLAQTYANWELIIADDQSATRLPDELTQLLGGDPRILRIDRAQRGGVSAASETARARAQGEWLVYLDQDDVLSEVLLERFSIAAHELPDAVVMYGDECHIDDSGRPRSHHYKPAFNSALLLAQNYVNHPCAIRADAVAEVGGLRATFDGAQDLDLLFRVAERARADQIVHVPGVLYGWRQSRSRSSISLSQPSRAASAGVRAVKESLARRGIEGEVTSTVGGWRKVYPRPQTPLEKTTIVIATRNNPKHLARCLKGLASTTASGSFRLVIVDHQNTEVRSRNLIDRTIAEGGGDVSVVPWTGPFNYASMMNMAAMDCDTGSILFLNDDVEPLVTGWLETMLGWLAIPDVAIVGAKLLYPSGLVQHSGLTVGIGAGAGSRLKHASCFRKGPFGRLVLTREVSAVTGACMLVRTPVLRALSGFDSRSFPVSYNDVDLCLRASQLGWRTVWCADALLIHHESATRRRNSAETQNSKFLEERRFRARWSQVFGNDPLDHPIFRRDTERFIVAGNLPPFSAPRVRETRRADGAVNQNIG